MEITYHSPQGMRAGGHYTPAVEVCEGRRMLYVSGQGPLNPQTGQKYLGDDIRKQTRMTLESLKRVVESSGFDMSGVVKATVFLKNMDDAATINNVYAEYFPENPPARSTMAVTQLPSGQALEIEAIVAI